MTRAFTLSLCFLVACSSAERDPSQFPISRSELVQHATPPAQRDAAAITYRRYCIGCHGADGRGNGGTTGADLTAANGPLHTRSDVELIASVRNGKTGKVASMPAHSPVLRDDQISAVVAYIHRQFAGDASAPAPM